MWDGVAYRDSEVERRSWAVWVDCMVEPSGRATVIGWVVGWRSKTGAEQDGEEVTRSAGVGNGDVW